jgi:asparagine synthase (glutamine-hydrolysing)
LINGSPDLVSVINEPGLRIFHALHTHGACRAYKLRQNAGVILGRVFAKASDLESTPCPAEFDQTETDRIIESQGRRVVEHYWGHYIAVLKAPGGECRFILRDPTGGLPCFMASGSGIEAIASDVEDLSRLGLTSFSVNWSHVIAFFSHDRLVSRSTGLNEITQLYAGECMAIEEEKKSTSFYWSPVSVCEANLIDDPAKARAVLRNRILDCVGAWASGYESIVHELSGGLDSSIVAACLSRTTACSNVLLFHYFAETSEGDERPYAREAAKRTGYELVERNASATEIPLASQLDLSRLATPGMLGFHPPPELLKKHLVSDRHAGAVFSGQGGDHLFQQGRNINIAAEFARRHGFRPPLLRVVAEVSRLTNESFWTVLATSVTQEVLGRTFDPYFAYVDSAPLLTDNARAELTADAYTHPWVRESAELSASKIKHIFNVVDCQPPYLYPCRYAEQVHPLISQPIVECCLQIPTYLLARGGRERGLVREAFEGDVSPMIIRRRSKGVTTGYFNQLFIENLPFLRSLLLDGELVREGILERSLLQEKLSEKALLRGVAFQSVMSALRAETWLRAWIPQGCAGSSV